jgi:antitoxin component YwqK of YwqJK toxin-antitoxin module
MRFKKHKKIQYIRATKIHHSRNSMKQFVYFILVILIPFIGYSQGTLNKKDAAGRRQGQWIKLDSTGHKVYEGQFKDNIPQGTFKYYFKNGSVKAISVFSADGKTTITTIYFPTGKKNAEGKYVNEKREGLWRFFSEYDESLVSEETYSDGKKNGVARNYFAGKNVLEEITWKDGMKDGKWVQYFDDGTIKLQGSYKDDFKEGPMTVNYPTGQKFNVGQYKKGYPDGIWLTYDVDGKLISTDVYENGVLVKTDKTPQPPEKEIKVKQE